MDKLNMWHNGAATQWEMIFMKANGTPSGVKVLLLLHLLRILRTSKEWTQGISEEGLIGLDRKSFGVAGELLEIWELF
jgi:hypothetical protein